MLSSSTNVEYSNYYHLSLSSMLSSILVLLHLKIHHNLAILSISLITGLGYYIETWWKLIGEEDVTEVVRRYYRIRDPENNGISGDKNKWGSQMYLDWIYI